MLNKHQIVTLLSRNDRIGHHAVGRALLVLLRNQTADEQRTLTTRHSNNTGFTKGDAKRGTSMATYYRQYGQLTPSQIRYWQHGNQNGIPRIGKYWRQLAEAAQEKQLMAVNS